MLSLSKVGFAFLLICNFYIHLACSTENTIRGRRFLCGVHAQDLVNVNCTFKRVNRTTEFWSFNLNYFVPFKNLHINITNYLQQQNLEYKPHMLVSFHVDVCKFVDGSLVNKVMDILVGDLKRYGNSLMACPQYGHLYLRNMTFDDTNYPPIVPSGDSYIDFQYYTYIDGRVRKLFYLRPYLEVRYKGINYW